MSEENGSVHLSSCGSGKATLSGLREDELELLQGAVLGVHRVHVEDGRMKGISRYAVPPTPIPDPIVAEHFTDDPIAESQGRLFTFEESSHWCSPSISIQHLCGYCYTPERYRETAEKLESYGFACMRSKRGNDGRYWEIWFLPSTWSAKGELRTAVDQVPRDNDANHEIKKCEAAVKFLARNVSFGTLDVSIQRLAMTIE